MTDATALAVSFHDFNGLDPQDLQRQYVAQLLNAANAVLQHPEFVTELPPSELWLASPLARDKLPAGLPHPLGPLYSLLKTTWSFSQGVVIERSSYTEELAGAMAWKRQEIRCSQMLIELLQRCGLVEEAQAWLHVQEEDVVSYFFRPIVKEAANVLHLQRMLLVLNPAFYYLLFTFPVRPLDVPRILFYLFVLPLARVTG